MVDLPPIPGWSTNPVRYLVWAGVVSLAVAFAGSAVLP